MKRSKLLSILMLSVAACGVYAVSATSPAFGVYKVDCSADSDTYIGIPTTRNNSMPATPVILNCIFWDDGEEINSSDYQSKSVVHSIVKGGYDGVNISSEDPLLGELGNYGGYTRTIPINKDSPAIRLGLQHRSAPLFDARGIYRKSNPCIGAYEYIGSTKYENWALSNKLENSDQYLDTTPFNDGISNIEKFAFGLSGNKAASYSENALFKQSYSDGKANFQFPISKDAADSVSVKVMTSEDLVNWEEAQSSNIGESGDFNLMQTEQTVPEGGKLFFKLVVEEK